MKPRPEPFCSKQASSLFLLALALAASGCSELGAGTGQISKRIGDITRDPSAKEVNLPKLTTFGWDRFYYFKPGTSRDEICKFIGAGRSSCGRIIRYEAVPADHVALVFGLGQNLTHTELHALANGQFDMAVDERGFPRERSIFGIRRSASGTSRDIIILEPR